MPKLIAFEPKHLQEIKMRPFDIGNIDGLENWRQVIESQARNGTAYTGIVDDGNVIAIGGVCVARMGVGVAWAITSDLLVKYKIITHRTIRDMLGASIKKLSLHRVETAIIVDHTISHKWVERLGFKREGLMRKFDQNQNDYYLYARVI